MRLHVVAEGRSEERFVKDSLTPYLARNDVFTDVRLIQTGRSKKRKDITYKGGLLRYAHLKRDLEYWMRQDRDADCFFTTMVDLYAFPHSSESDPGPYTREIESITDPYCKVEALEQSIRMDFNNDRRLVPYIQLHEFEALVLTAPLRLCYLFPHRESGIVELNASIAGVESPETVNEGATTAPSKRIERYIPEYASQKPTAGPLVVEDIGIERLRDECPHFASWLTTLESLSDS